MRVFVFALVAVVTSADAICDPWPNGTDTAFRWWQCNDGPMIYRDAKLYDETGTKEQYPVHMDKPMVVKCEIVNPTTVYGSPDLKLNIRLWSWGVIKKQCTWLPIPTLGLLDNLDACQHGIKCPIALGHQTIDVIVDFTRFSTIVKLLKDDAPYQLQYELRDRATGDKACLMAQARARTK
ncbi:hypothetical protein COOONC_06535 [Cooperia oncophora]